MKTDLNSDLQPMTPITPKEFAQFRELIVPPELGNDKTRDERLAQDLGVNASSVWRMRQPDAVIQHGTMVRRALVQIADELRIELRDDLRYGRRAKGKRAGAR